MKLRNAEQNNTNVPCRTCFSLEREHFVRCCPERSSITCKTKIKYLTDIAKSQVSNTAVAFHNTSCLLKLFCRRKLGLLQTHRWHEDVVILLNISVIRSTALSFLALVCIKDHCTVFSGIMWLRKWHSHLRSPRSLTPDWLLLSAAPLKADLAAQRTCKWSLWDLWPAIRLW